MTDAMRELDADECWRLLSKESVGRFVRTTDTGPEIFPVNFTVHERTIFFRSAPGSKLVDLQHHDSVVFEADRHRGRRAWSVVVHGTAHRLNVDAEIERSGVLALTTFAPGDRQNFVAIVPTAVSGRSLKRGR
jgi:nitroimidazol reductase NimA-like FMN-containing flavoprotein (pyridoxamine 5'-phosphate oxidase superfamily)